MFGEMQRLAMDRDQNLRPGPGQHLAQFVEETASAIEEMIVSINEVASNTETFSSFAIETVPRVGYRLVDD